jgi:hypothetical protein
MEVERRSKHEPYEMKKLAIYDNNKQKRYDDVDLSEADSDQLEAVR